MDKEIKITKIIINIKDKELELSLEEAKELSKTLKELFPENKDYSYIQYIPYTPPVTVPIDPNPYKWYPIICGNDVSGNCITLSYNPNLSIT
jgi:hypothetical protein